MNEALGQSLGYYYNIALLIGQQAELIMQSPLLSTTTYAYDSQQVIYTFDKMQGRVSKNLIHRDCRR